MEGHGPIPRTIEEEFDGLIERYRGEIIAIQAPEGLKITARRLVEDLQAKGVMAILIGDPCFGACGLADEEAERHGAVALIHLGHAPMPGVKPVIPVHYIEWRDEPPMDFSLDEASSLLISPVGLTTTVQHVGLLERVRDRLQNEHGMEVLVGERGGRTAYDGQVLGCDMSSVHTIDEDAGSYLYIGTGRFHPAGIAISTGKAVVTLDPHSGTVDYIEPEHLLRQRWGAIARAKDANRIGIIVGTMHGQDRTRFAMNLRQRFENEGKSAFIITTRVILPENLAGLGVDAIVVTACPRIAFDDGARFDVPVLTAMEACMLLSSAEDYVLDEFGDECA